MAQALNSASGLIAEAHRGLTKEGDVALILPVVVVPDGRLWRVEFNEKGEMTGKPAVCTWARYYVKHAIASDLIAYVMPAAYEISHVEFVSRSGLAELIRILKSPEGHYNIFGR